MGITIDASQVGQVGAQLKSLTPQKLLTSVRPTLSSILARSLVKMKNAVSGDVLAVRSGNLKASLDIDPVHLEGDKVVGGVNITGSAVKYGTFLIRGGTIHAKNGKFLAIPLPAALTAAGVPKYASPLRETLKSAFPAGTFVSHGVLFGKLGTTAKGQARTSTRGQFGFGRSNFVALFDLLTSVTIKPHDYVTEPRQYVERTVAEEVPGAVVSQIFQK